MRRAFVVALVLASISSASGCWPQRGFNAGRSYWNPYETELTSSNVHGLTTVWDTFVGPEPGGVRELVAVGDGVFATGGSGVVARMESDDGELVWRRVVDPGQTSPPPGLGNLTAFRGRLVVTWACCRFGIGGAYWLDQDDGEIVEDPGVPGLGSGTIADVASAGGVLASLSGREFTQWILWGSRVIEVGLYSTGAPGPTIAIVGDKILWSYGNDAVSFGPECRPSSDPGLSCEPEWWTDLGEPYTQPAALGTRSAVYTEQSGGSVTVLDAATGAVRWRGELGYYAGPTAPVVTHGMIVVGTNDGRVAGFRARGCGADVCEPVWETAVTGDEVTELAAGGDVVYAITAAGDLHALAVDGCGAETCAPLTTLHTGRGLLAPIVHAGRVIVGTADGHVLAFGLPHGG